MRGHRVRACEIGSLGLGGSVEYRQIFQICCQWIQRYLHRWSRNSPVCKFSCFPFIFKCRTGYPLTFQKEKGRAYSLPLPAASTIFVPSTLVRINTTFTHAGSIWRWTPPDSFKSLSLHHIPFALLHFCFPVQLESPLVYLTSELR